MGGMHIRLGDACVCVCLLTLLAYIHPSVAPPPPFSGFKDRKKREIDNNVYPCPLSPRLEL